jgi:hypothetical protein
MADIPDFGSIPDDLFAGGAHLAGQDSPHLAEILNKSGLKSIHGPARLSLIAASAEVHRFRWPGPTVQVAELHTALSDALATGDATLTASIEKHDTDGAVATSTAVTGGVITITETGSAAGDVDAATPTDENILEYGDCLVVTVGGANTADVHADLTFLVRAVS